MTRVLVIGGLAYNTMIYLGDFPEPRPQLVFVHGFHETVGSSGAGKALNLAGLGLDVTLHALLGDDDAGHKASAILATRGVRLVHDPDPGGTKRHTNLMDEDGDRISIHIVPGTFEPAIDLTRLESEIAACDVVALNIINYCRHAIPICKRLGKPIWCDIHDYDGQNPYHQDFIDAADVLHMSSNEMPDYRPFMEAQIAAGKQMITCTHGRHGATTLTAAGEWIETPIIPAYERVDTNGAGDAFFSGMLYGHLHGYPLADCLRLGAVVSGLSINNYELAHPDLSPTLVQADYVRHFGTAPATNPPD